MSERYIVTDIDKYLVSNQKDFFDLITKGWGSKDPTVIEAKYWWNKAKNATSTNDKLAAWSQLQDVMEPYFKNAKERDAKSEQALIDAGLKEWKVKEDRDDAAFDKALIKFADSRPNAEDEKLENLKPEEAFYKNYDRDQMKHLAEQYGYNYDDPNDRKEFIKQVAEVTKQYDLEKIWNDNTIGGLYTSMVTPIAKEYARRNYDKIDSDDYIGIGPFGIPTNTGMAGAVAGDVGVNTLMSGPFKFNFKGFPRASEVSTTLANNVAAPVARQGLQVGLNDKELSDAAKDFVGETITNYATPLFVGGAKNRLAAMTQGKSEIKTAQKLIDDAATKMRDISSKLENGVPIVTKDVTGKLHYFQVNKKLLGGNEIVELDAAAARKAANGKDMIPLSDYKFFEKNMPMVRGNGPLAQKDPNTQLAYSKAIKDIKKRKGQGYSKAKTNEEAGNQWYTGLDAAEAAGAVKMPGVPTESRLNQISYIFGNNPITQGGSNYLNNQLGRSQYAGRTVNQLSRLIPGGENINWFSSKDKTVEPLSDTDKSELRMYGKLYKAHEQYPKLFGKPKLPEKYKKYDEQTLIDAIFGE